MIDYFLMKWLKQYFFYWISFQSNTQKLFNSLTISLAPDRPKPEKGDLKFDVQSRVIFQMRFISF